MLHASDKRCTWALAEKPEEAKRSRGSGAENERG